MVQLPVLLAICAALVSPTPRVLYGAVDWTLPCYYETTQAVQAGNRLVHLTRGPNGVLVSTFDTIQQKWVSSKEFAWAEDVHGWCQSPYFQTISMVALDSNVYLYTRWILGSLLVKFDPATATFTSFPNIGYFADAYGYVSPPYCWTIRVAALGSCIYVTGMGNGFFDLVAFDTLTSTWSSLPSLVDPLILAWTQPMYYETFQIVGQGTLLWFMMRGQAGLYIFSFDTLVQTWSFSGAPTLLDYRDSVGWDQPQHYKTIQLRAVSNGLYIAGRGISWVISYFYNTNTHVFQPVSGYLEYTDVEGWAVSQYYHTVKITACEDSLVIIGRGANMLVTGYLQSPTSNWQPRAPVSTFTDANHWDDIYRYWGLSAVCIGDSLYVVGRDLDYLKTERYRISTDTWTSVETITSRNCDPTCQVCLSTSNLDCTYCYPGAHLTALSPAQCICDNDHYPDPTSANCSPCHSSCKKCSSSSDYGCLECYPNSALIGSAPNFCQCNSGAFPDNSPAHCTLCALTCRECQGPSPQDCTMCLTNAELLHPPVSSCECKAGFGLSSALVCVLCNKQCYTCREEANNCLSCKVYASLSNGKCMCDRNYYMDTSNGECYQCNATCKSCSGPLSTHCEECMSGAALSSASECTCKSGYFPNPDAVHCRPCSHLCAKCISAETCSECLFQAKQVNNSCQCIEGAYEQSDIPACAQCPLYCSACIATGCLSCVPNWILYHAECVQVCPLGMLVIENRCVEAPPEPSLAVLPNNTLDVRFSKSLARPLLASDYALLLSDYYSIYTPAWNMTVLETNRSYQIELDLSSFKQPKDYSSIQLIFNDPTSLRDSESLSISKSTLNATLYPFPPLLQPLPSPVGLSSPAAVQAATTVKGATTAALTSALFAGNPISMFSLLNQLQLITFIPMVNVTLPDQFANSLLGLNVNEFVFNPFDHLYDVNKANKPPTFIAISGFETSLFLLNSSSLVLTSIWIIASYTVVTLLANIISLPTIQYSLAHLQVKYHWEVLLRTWIQLYLDVGVCSLLQFYEYSWSQYGGKENGIVAGTFLAVFFLTPGFIIVFTISNRNLMLSRANSDFNARWGTLYEEFRRTEGLQSIAFYAYFVSRRCLYAVVLVCMHSYPTFQLFSSLTTSLMVITI